MQDDFQRASIIRPGFWYAFQYKNIHAYKQGYDPYPYIYCLEDMPTKNCFVGINVHKMYKEDRAKLLRLMLNETADDNSAWPFDSNWFKNNFRSYASGEFGAIRIYNKKNVFEPFQVNFNAVKYYIMFETNPIGENRDYEITKYNLERNENA